VVQKWLRIWGEFPFRKHFVPAAPWASPVRRIRNLYTISREFVVGGISDRKQEIKRRRHRKKKLVIFKRKLKKATASEKLVIADKIRNMTPGAEIIIANLGIDADAPKKR